MEVLILYREEILLTLELHCNVCIEKYIACTILRAYFRQIVIVDFEEFLWKKFQGSKCVQFIVSPVSYIYLYLIILYLINLESRRIVLHVPRSFYKRDRISVRIHVFNQRQINILSDDCWTKH